MYATIMRALEKNPNLILLNAGDNFEGTLWYNVHKWNVTQYFLNKLPTDAYVRYLALSLNKKEKMFLDIRKPRI